jgi:hypothetical protein
VRLALGDVVTNEDLREHLEEISRRLDRLHDDPPTRADRPHDRRAAG